MLLNMRNIILMLLVGSMACNNAQIEQEKKLTEDYSQLNIKNINY